MKNSRLVHGVGIYDGNYTFLDGKQYRPYSMWSDMIRRCYSKTESDKNKNSSYLDCTVCEDWLTFSNFEQWVITQPDYLSKQLDKDLLVFGNKVYSPETCVLISKKLNTFLTDLRKNNKEFIGSHPYPKGNRARAYISNPITNQREYLGSFASEHEAHVAWKKRKLELGLELVALEQDTRLIEAITERYNKLNLPIDSQPNPM